MSVNGIGHSFYQNNVSANKCNRSRAGQFYPQQQAAAESASEGTRQDASVQDIYESLKTTNTFTEREGSLVFLFDAGDLQAWYGGRPLEEWAAQDSKYVDEETGFTWYVRDGKHPYMVGEDAEKFKEMCKKTGESWLKKFAEMTGMIQHLDDNTTAFAGVNGMSIRSKDGKSLFVDTRSMSYDMIMNMFQNAAKGGDYFDSSYWEKKIQEAMASADN